ncbi:MAG TPA: hypothetical protein PKA61_08940 [Nitrospira sp.]|nr:hypothetical protein [Nitrospira sp.]
MKWLYPTLVAVLLALMLTAYLTAAWSPSFKLSALWNQGNRPANVRGDVGKSVEGKTVLQDVLLEELRRTHNLRPLTDQESGAKIQNLPMGVFGFSECSESLEAKRGGKPSLEVQKRRDGIAYYVGYASDEDIGKYFARIKNFHILTYNQATSKAPSLFEIPVDFVAKCEARQLADGPVFDLFVRDIPELQS